MRSIRILGIAVAAAFFAAGMVWANGSSEKSGNGAASSGPTKITVFTWGFPAEKIAREKQAEIFNQKFPNIHVDLQVSPDYDRKLDAMLAANAGPDVMETSDDWYHLRATNGQLVDLRPYIQKDGLDLNKIFYPRAVTGYTLPDGMVEAMPFGIDLFVMAYNKDLFQAAGLKDPTNGWTWAQALADAQALTKGSGVDKVYGMSDLWMYAQIAAYLDGGAYTSSDFKTVTADSPAAIRGVQFVADLRFKYHVMASVSESTTTGLSGTQRFFAGKSGMIPMNNWDLGSFEQSIGNKFHWGIVTMPTMQSTGQSTSWYITEGYGMWSKSKHKNADWQFMKWATTSPESMPIISGAAIPAAKAGANVFLKSPTDPQALDLQAFLDQINGARLSPFGGIFAQIGNLMTNAWDEINTQKMTVPQAMQQFTQQAQAALPN